MAKRKKQYHVNRRKLWLCPYFGWDGPDFLRCECGRPAFPDRTAANEYMTKHCAGSWEECSLAKAWIEHEEIRDEKGRNHSNAEQA